MKRWHLPILLGLSHGVADGAAGLLLGNLSQRLPLATVGTLVLFYNLLAFGGQPVAGLLTDRLQRPRLAALSGLALLGLALGLAPWQATGAIMLAGLGSAAFHVGGGALALCHAQGRATGPGLFAAPGVAGLALGGAIAVRQGLVIWPFLGLLLLLAIGLSRLELPPLPYQTHPSLDEPLFAGHDWLMLILLIAIALRSAVWNIFQVIEGGHYLILVWLALAAMMGKIIGGFMADWLGWRRWTVAALVVATPLLAFGGQTIIILSMGIALLQSATPAMLVATAQFTPHQPATAAGMALGLAIALGGIPFLAGPLPVLRAPPTIFLTGLVAIVAVWWAMSHPTPNKVFPHL